MKIFYSVIATAALFVAGASADTVYNSTGSYTVANNAQHYMEVLTLPATSPFYTITDVKTLVDWVDITKGKQFIVATIFTGVNPANPLGVLNNASIIGSSEIGVNPPMLAGEDDLYSLNLTETDPGTLTVPAGTTIGVEFLLLAQFNYGTKSTSLSPDFTSPPANPGTAVSLYTNTDTSSTTDFTPAQVSLTQAAYLTVIATPVPEPSALLFTAVAGCAMLGSFIHFRKVKIS